MQRCRFTFAPSVYTLVDSVFARRQLFVTCRYLVTLREISPPHLYEFFTFQNYCTFTSFLIPVRLCSFRVDFWAVAHIFTCVYAYMYNIYKEFIADTDRILTMWESHDLQSSWWSEKQARLGIYLFLLTAHYWWYISCLIYIIKI